MPFLFGYGSLISGKSASKTLQRELKEEELLEAVLVGYERVWQLVAPLRIAPSYEKVVEGIFLDIVPSKGTTCVGSIFFLSDRELEYFDQRERQYSRLDVTDLILPRVSDLTFTYVGRPEHTNPGPNAVVMSEYERLVDRALAEKRACFQSLWKTSTRRHGFVRMDGQYQFDNDQQQSSSGR